MTDAGVETGVHLRACTGEVDSGDTAVLAAHGAGCFVAIADVLGHGRQAHEIAERIAAFLRDHAGSDLIGLMEQLHEHLKGTRGAAVGLGYVDERTGRLCYVGIGNICIRRFGSAETGLISRDGTVGHRIRTPRAEFLQLEAGDLIVLTTDGVKKNFGVGDYPGLLRDSAASVARMIVQRFGKEHDDATCVALRYRP